MANYTVFGAGRLGGALAQRLAGLGHQVTAIVRNSEDEKYEALRQTAGVTLTSASHDAEGADIVFLATPWDATKDAIAPLGDGAGRIIVDCTNPVTYGANGMALAIDANTSAAETIQGWLPEGKIVKALNQVG